MLKIQVVVWNHGRFFFFLRHSIEVCLPFIYIHFLVSKIKLESISKDCRLQSVTNNIPKPFEVPKKGQMELHKNAPFWGVNVLIEGGIGGKASQEFVNRNIEILKYIIN